MQRRTFNQISLLGAGAAMSGALHRIDVPRTSKTFPLNFAPHLGMFSRNAGEDAVAQLEYMASVGFTAFEDNDMRKRTPEEQSRMATAMARLGIKMGVFVAHKIYWTEPNLASGDPDLRSEFLSDIRASVEVAKRVRAKWMTVVPGHVDARKDMGYQMANVIETLKQASAILEEQDLVMVLEPLNFRNHPGMFLTKSSQAYEICRAVGSPSCKILFDIYHQQITEGNLIPNIEGCWDEIAYFQIGDNPGRNEPTTGEINYRNIFRYIALRGYDGILGMEHGNSIPGTDGEKAVIEAYRTCTIF